MNLIMEKIRAATAEEADVVEMASLLEDMGVEESDVTAVEGPILTVTLEKVEFTPTEPAYRVHSDHHNQSCWIEKGMVGKIIAERHWCFDFDGATDTADDELPWHKDREYVPKIVLLGDDDE